jgi:lambda repressor-like predicted transcriptional regulator
MNGESAEVVASPFTGQLAGEIRARMGRRNMSTADLSEQTGLAYSTLARKIKGDQPFTTVELETIAKVLDTTIQALILSVRVPA